MSIDTKTEAKVDATPEKSDKKDAGVKLKMIENLKHLFASLVKSNKKYSDASPVLRELKDEFGQGIPIGDQKDVSEFHLKFIECLEVEVKSSKVEEEQKASEESKEEAKGEKPAEEPDFNRNHSTLDPTGQADMNVDGPGAPGKIKDLLISHLDNNQDAVMDIDEERIDTTKPTDKETEIINQIEELFTGKIEQIILFEDEDVKHENTSKDEFKFLYLHPKDKDLYSAWETTFQTVIEGYKPEDKVYDTAIKQRWITKLPKVLFFLVTRVYYDKEKKSMVKDNEPFDFEEVIYPDRYLLQNRDVSDQLRNQVNKLRVKTVKLQEHIDKFKNYNEKKHNIGAILHSTAHLLQSSNEGMQSEDSTEGVSLYSPSGLLQSVADSPDQETISKMIEFLTNLQTKSIEQVKHMEEQLSELQSEIKNFYKSVDKTAYHLHSIMIHDGNHESGHYYTFIKDHSKDLFRRYNDISVIEVDRQRVFEESKGGMGTINAYCLVYVNDEIHKTCAQKDLHNYSLQSWEAKETDIYNQMIPPNIADKIYQDNDSLVLTIREAECMEMVKEIGSLYDKRYAQIKAFLDEHKPNLKYSSPITQFFEIQKGHKLSNENIAKWFLLDL